MNSNKKIIWLKSESGFIIVEIIFYSKGLALSIFI